MPKTPKIELNQVLHPDDFADPVHQAGEALLKSADPALWSRKIPGATFQYVHLLTAAEQLLNLGARQKAYKILVIGAYEDPIAAIVPDYLDTPEDFQPVDPNVNGLDLAEFLNRYPYVRGTYDLVVAASVLEHVPDDVAFLADMVSALKPGGIGLLTCDFKGDWQPGDALAPTEERLYTPVSLMALTDTIVPETEFIGDRDWTPRGDYFSYAGVDYAFASIGFRKLENP